MIRALFGWCLDGHHATCRCTATVNGRTITCSCTCHGAGR